MSISKETKKKDKKRKNKHKQEEQLQDGEEPKKRVRFDMSQNKVTEFFKHGKVATRTLAITR